METKESVSAATCDDVQELLAFLNQSVGDIYDEPGATAEVFEAAIQKSVAKFGEIEPALSAIWGVVLWCDDTNVIEPDSNGGELLWHLCDVVHEYWNRPIPVSERLPKFEQHCLIWDGDRWLASQYLGRRTGWYCDAAGRRTDSPITHWLPLPPAPSATESSLPAPPA